MTANKQAFLGRLMVGSCRSVVICKNFGNKLWFGNLLRLVLLQWLHLSWFFLEIWFSAAVFLNWQIVSLKFELSKLICFLLMINFQLFTRKNILEHFVFLRFTPCISHLNFVVIKDIFINQLEFTSLVIGTYFFADDLFLNRSIYLIW